MITATSFLYILLLAVGLAGIIFLVFVKTLWNQLNGILGEKEVAKELARELARGEYLILNDLLYPASRNGNTKVTQIDHIVVSTHGIFCIETKIYKGRIFGRAGDKYWTKTIHNHEYKFYNPFRQNFAHTESIKRMLEPRIVRVPIISLVVFPYAEKIEAIGTTNVGTIDQLIDMVTRHQGNIYSADERDEIYARLKRMNIMAAKWRRHHIKTMKALQRRNILSRTSYAGNLTSTAQTAGTLSSECQMYQLATDS